MRLPWIPERMRRGDLICQGAAIILLAAGAILRFVSLNADPSSPLWQGYIVDEGRWVHQARNIALFGCLSDDGLSRMHLAVAPGYQLITLLNFSIFGVNWWSARMYSALCGCAIPLATYIFFRSRLSVLGMIVALAILSLDRDMVFLSRLAIAEVPTMLWACLAFLSLCSESASARGAALGGCITIVAVATKATSAPLLFLFFLISILDFDNAKISLNFRRGRAFLLSVTVPLALGILFLFSFMGVESVLSTSGFLQESIDVLTQRPANSLYLFASRFLNNDHVYVVNFLLLIAWVCAGILLLSGIPLSQRSMSVAYIGSLIWGIGWLAIPLFGLYFPHRYIFQAIPPLAIHVAVGITFIHRVGATTVFDRLAKLRKRSRVIAVFWFVLPTAVCLAPLVVAMADLGGFQIDRMRERLLLIALLSAGLAGVLYGSWGNRRIVGAWLLFPLVSTLAWFIAASSGVISGEYWSEPSHESVAARVLLVGASVMISLLLSWDAGARRETRRVWGVVFLLVVVLLLSLRVAPDVTQRHYTIESAARQLQMELQDVDLVQSICADSTFIGNTLRCNLGVADFDEGVGFVTPLLAVMVVNPAATINPNIQDALREEYELVKEFEIHTDPRLLDKPDHWSRFSMPGRFKKPSIQLYRLKNGQ